MASLDQAKAVSTRGEVPVGAVVVDDTTGTVIARAGNAVEASHGPPTPKLRA